MSGLVIGTAFLVLFVAVPIAAAAILMQDGALSRWVTRARRAVARFVQVGPHRERAASHPAGSKRVPGLPQDGDPLTDAELEAFAVLMFAAKVPQGQEPPQTT